MTKLIFFGSSQYVLPIISMLKENFDLALVVTTEQNETSPVPAFCKTQNIPYLSVQKLNTSILPSIEVIHAEVAVLASFGLILPQKLLDIFPKGILNIHPSLLPKYRGTTPVQAAILNADNETGVTIIKLDKEMDHGPILAQEKETIKSTDTAENLYTKLFIKGSDILLQVLPKYITSKGIWLREQNHETATYTQRVLTRQDGFIDLENPPTPEQLDRMIRAYHPWPGVHTKLKVQNEKLKIIKFLPEGKIQVEGKKATNLKNFYNGYPQLISVVSPLFSSKKAQESGKTS